MTISHHSSCACRVTQLSRMFGRELSLVSGGFVLLLLAHLHVSISAQQIDKRTFKKTFVEAAKKCSKEVGPPTALSVTYLTSPEITDRNSKCFSACLLNKFNLMDKQGQYNQRSMQTFLNSIPESRFKSSIKRNLSSCLQENSKDVCDKGYKFIQCFYRRA